MISSSSRSFTNSNRTVKRIYVWENGDCNGNGHVLVINPKLYRSWNNILSLITNTLRPTFGFVRTLIHLDTKEIVRSFETLKPNGKYVALGTEKLKLFKDGYKTLKEKQTTQVARPGTVRVVIFVLANGKTRETPCKVVITDFDTQAWRLVLRAIARKLDIPIGIRYLTNVNGEAVLDPSSLQNGLIYVAVPYDEDFSRLDYNRIFRSLLPMREVDLKDLTPFTEVQGTINDPVVLQADCYNAVAKSKSEGFNTTPKQFPSQKRDCHTLTDHPKCATRGVSIQNLLDEVFIVDLTEESDENSSEEDFFPFGTQSRSCGCSKANKATVTDGLKGRNSVFCVKDAASITEEPATKLTGPQKPLTVNTVKTTREDAKFQSCHSRSSPGNLEILVKTDQKVSNNSRKSSLDSKSSPENLQTTVKTLKSTKGCGNLVTKKQDKANSKRIDSEDSKIFIETPRKEDKAEVSKSLPENVETAEPKPKLCYCKACQTKPNQPCAPGQCAKTDKGQLARVTRKPPPATSSSKVHSASQTTKRSKSYCKWLMSTFRTSRSSEPGCVSKAAGSDQNDRCCCASKGCCNPELCNSGVKSEQEQDQGNFCYPDTCQLIGYKSVCTEASCQMATKGDEAPSNSSAPLLKPAMSSDGGKLPHTAKFLKLPAPIECVVRPGRIVFRKLNNPQVELLYQSHVDESDDDDAPEEDSEIQQIHMSVEEFIDDVIDTSVYLIDKFEMLPKERLPFPLRQPPVTIPSEAREVINDIITKSSLTVDQMERPSNQPEDHTPVEPVLSLPPKCPELHHGGCCPCPAALTTSKDVVEFASQYDPHYTKSLTQCSPDISEDSLDEDEMENLRSTTPRTSILRTSIASSPYSIQGMNKQRVSIKLPGTKKLLYTYSDSRSDMRMKNEQSSGSSGFLQENMIFEQFRSEPTSLAQSTATVCLKPSETAGTQTPECYCKEPSCKCKFECLGRSADPTKLSEMSVLTPDTSLTGMLVGEHSTTYNGPASIEVGVGGPSSSIIDNHLRLFDLPTSKASSKQSGSMFCIRSSDAINKSF